MNFVFIIDVFAQDISKDFILIISSYNPETPATSRNISEFIAEYEHLGGRAEIALENLNCKSFTEILAWPIRLGNIMTKYDEDNKPKFIILLGQEAAITYFSSGKILENVPVLVAMVSKNAIKFPSSEPGKHNPEFIDFIDEFSKYTLLGGCFYEYDIATNINLILDFYPETENIAFLTDNSYGGVSLQTLMMREMKKYPKLNLKLIDGREHSIHSLGEAIKELPDNTVLLFGTWRVDKNESYFMRESLQAVKSHNPNIPAFTLTSMGLGYWAIGGFMPEYKTYGKDLAKKAIDIENNILNRFDNNLVELIPNKYGFDYDQLRKYNFQNKDVVSYAEIYNRKISFFKVYKYELFGLSIIFVAVVASLVVVSHFFFKLKKVKDELLISQKDKTLILNNMQAGIKFVDNEYKIKWHNRYDYEKRDYLISNLEGKYCFEALHGLDKPCKFCPISMAVKSKEAFDVTIKNDDLYVNMLANPVYDNHSNLIGVVVRTEDVTKQKNTEIELRVAKEKAEESDRLKSAFLANMSHEIRTPLNAIVGFSNVLISDNYDDENRNDYLDIIQKNSDLLLHLINDILDISRLETGKIKVNYEECDVVSLCSDILITTEFTKSKDVEYIFLPDYFEYIITTDLQRLQQILINLISNANKFTEQGFIKIEFIPNEENNTITFIITDTGCGIPANKQVKVFERFEKLDEYAQGSGLGLAICKLTVELLDGKIWIDKEYIGGTRFIFTIPTIPIIKQ